MKQWSFDARNGSQPAASLKTVEGRENVGRAREDAARLEIRIPTERLRESLERQI